MTFYSMFDLRDEIIARLQNKADRNTGLAMEIIHELAMLVDIPQLIDWAEREGYITLDDEEDYP